jgi:2-polyprenyl-6-methoxyphenol hydroxylase-like FAD-dependent oxidoreductase
VLATLRDLSTGEIRSMRTDYLVGCAGGNSMVRKHLGAPFTGTDMVLQAMTIYFRAPALAEIIQSRAWMTWSVNRDVLCVTVAIDGHNMSLIHAFSPADTELADPEP